MNRSIFQMWCKSLGGVTILTFFLLISDFSFYANCTNFKCSKDVTKYILQEMCYNDIKFYKAACINDYNSKIALDLFLEYKEKNNFNYKISKYFLNKNGILIPFDKKSSYSHPNLYLGNFNSILFNYQFSHKNVINSFELFTVNDIVSSGKQQYFCNNLYMYNNDLSQLMLNFNDISYNEQFKSLNNELLNEINKDSLKAQNYLDNNKNNFNKFINNSLKN